MLRETAEELHTIIARTAHLSGHLRQFEMSSSKAYRRASDEDRIQSLQEHVEQLYGMVQRVCAILLEGQ